MNNAEKFKQIFGLYATELWSMPESDFLAWLNRDVETTQTDHIADSGKKVEAEDYISRRAAIEALEEQLDYLQMLNKDENPTAESKWYGVNWARNTIAELPSAQPERKTGRWIVHEEGITDVLECSECGKLIDFTHKPKYCEECGVKMEVEHETL